MAKICSLIILLSVPFLIFNCGNSKSGKKTDSKSEHFSEKKVITKPVDISVFETTNLIEPISKQEVKLENGSIKEFYKIITKPQPIEHEAGPWCPITINDSKEKGGVWFKDGHLYDVDGSFIAHLDDFYNDPKWKLYKENGEIKITKTQEACEGAAKPDVEEEYYNYCVECSPSYYKNVTNTFLIPVEPVFKEKITQIGRGGIGLAFNGVKFDGPAPLNAIISAHTLAPLDDCGGHVNQHSGYHYHAAIGCTKKIEQTNNHSALIGYAIDGFGIYELDKTTNDLDECNGHEDNLRGYHYHVNKPGENQIINCLHGITAQTNNKRSGHKPPPNHKKE